MLLLLYIVTTLLVVVLHIFLKAVVSTVYKIHAPQVQLRTVEQLDMVRLAIKHVYPIACNDGIY